MRGLGLGLGLSRRGGATLIDPLTLFENSEGGVFYDPATLSSLALTSGGAAGTVDVGDRTERMEDLSPNGIDILQATDASAPILRQKPSGLYCLEFDGTDDVLATGTVSLPTDALIVIGARGVVEVPTQFDSYVSFNSGTDWQLCTDNAFPQNDSLFNDGAGGNITGPDYDTDPHVFSAAISSSGIEAWRDGVSMGTATGQVTDTSGILRLAQNRGGTLNMAVEIYGLVIADASVHADKRADLEAYMAAKTGVSL